MKTGETQLEEKVKGFSVRFIIALTIFAVVLILFWLLTDEVVFEKENNFDLKVYSALSAHATPQLTKFMVFLTFFGSQDFLVPAYLLIVAWFLFIKKDRMNSLNIAAIALLGIGVLFLLKQTFHRSRPLEPLLQHARGFSYPSGHSFSAFTFCTILTYLIWRSRVNVPLKWGVTVFLVLFCLPDCA